MKRFISLLILMLPIAVQAQWTPWGLQLIQKPNLQSGQIYLGIVSFRAGSNVTFTPYGINTFSINAIGGGGGGGGINGTNGINGKNGTNGLNGATGAAGAAGSTGATGAPGATGATGPQGIAGVNGTNGLNGTNGINGSGGGGGSVAGVDYQEQDVTAYANGTNFNIDFSIPAQRWYATNFALRYSINWPQNSTSRFVNIFIPPTNITRRVWIYDAATNWQTAGLNTATLLAANQGAIIRANVFTQGETNVFVAIIAGKSVSSGNENFFNPLGIPGLILWINAGQGVWTNIAGTSSALSNGEIVRRWDDLSGTGNNLTNTGSNCTWQQFGGPNSTPAIAFNSAVSSVFKTVVSNSIVQPYSYFVVYSRSVTSASHTLIDTKGPSADVGLLDILSAGSVEIGSGFFISGNMIPKLNAQMIDCLFNSTSSEIYTNGVITKSGNAGTSGPMGFTVGGDAASSFRLGGAISEIMIWNTTLTSQNRTDIRSYLTQKYGPF